VRYLGALRIRFEAPERTCQLDFALTRRQGRMDTRRQLATAGRGRCLRTSRRRPRVDRPSAARPEPPIISLDADSWRAEYVDSGTVNSKSDQSVTQRASYRRCIERITARWPLFAERRRQQLQRGLFGAPVEKVAEEIVQDLFTDVLDWSLEDVVLQVGRADIVLTDMGVKRLVLEIKRPGALSWNRRSVEIALDQAGRYAAAQKVNAVAVSDGNLLYAADIVGGAFETVSSRSLTRRIRRSPSGGCPSTGSTDRVLRSHQRRPFRSLRPPTSTPHRPPRLSCSTTSTDCPPAASPTSDRLPMCTGGNCPICTPTPARTRNVSPWRSSRSSATTEGQRLTSPGPRSQTFSFACPWLPSNCGSFLAKVKPPRPRTSKLTKHWSNWTGSLMSGAASPENDSPVGAPIDPDMRWRSRTRSRRSGHLVGANRPPPPGSSPSTQAGFLLAA